MAPLLQINNPCAVVDNVELPQLFTTFTVGAGGLVLGEAVAVPALLTHPFAAVVVTNTDIVTGLALKDTTATVARTVTTRFMEQLQPV